jgi:hypothetical protein
MVIGIEIVQCLDSPLDRLSKKQMREVVQSHTVLFRKRWSVILERVLESVDDL